MDGQRTLVVCLVYSAVIEGVYANNLLFHSGSPFLRTTRNDKDDLIQSYAEACGCPKNQTVLRNVDCLNDTDVGIMVSASAAWEGSGTSLGGPIKDNVFRAVRARKYPKVPIVVSTCRDEGTSSAIGFKASSDEITALAIQGKSCATLVSFGLMLGHIQTLAET